MARERVVETRKDRIEMAHEAGFGSVSLGSVLAGMLVAFGAFAVLAAIAAGVLNAVGFDTSHLSTNDWRQLGVGGGVVVAVVLLLSYFYGGYVAGRMARRAGALNGFCVFVMGILVAVGIGVAVGTQADTGHIVGNLRSIGIPTTRSEWTAIGTMAGVGSLVAMLLGSILGGRLGERWHTKLVTRAMDPTVGPAASAHGEVLAAERRAEAARRREADLRGRHIDLTGRDESASESASEPATTTATTSEPTLDEDLAEAHRRQD